MDLKIKEQYDLWLKKAVADPDLIPELVSMDEEKIIDAFYRDLEFGTGGLRGELGAGTNRVNVYTIAKVSQGFANYILKHYPLAKRKVAISYDSRIKSLLFAKISAQVFAANGLVANLYKTLMPTPALSFAVRYLNCAGGVMITASHNPAQYNGYKAYDHYGCQITNEMAEGIFKEIQKVDIFSDVKVLGFEEAMEKGSINYIDDEDFQAYLKEVKKQSLLDTKINKNIRIIYSPLNGTGLVPVTRVLEECGYKQVIVVKEQAEPDGHFPTCPYPNPEIKEALELGLEYAKKYQADLLLASDPDGDRLGVAIKEKDNYRLLSGNESGILLLDYICHQRSKQNKMPKDPLLIKTIVSSDMAEEVAATYGLKTINVLTGFKYIGDQINRLEAKKKEDSFVFGFEESYGYLSGTYVRDKDAVNAALLVCEMFCYYHNQGISLASKIEDLYRKYGYYLNTVHSYEFIGFSGFKKMQEVMLYFRKGLKEIGGKAIEKYLDYLQGLDGLPPADVVKYQLVGDCSIIIRPSGTEPKLKVYISIKAQDKETALLKEQQVAQALKKIINSFN